MSVWLLLVVKASLVAAGGLLAVLLAHRSRAAVRHAILAATFAMLMALPLATWLAPAQRVTVSMPAAWWPAEAETEVAGAEARALRTRSEARSDRTEGQGFSRGRSEIEASLGLWESAVGIWVAGGLLFSTPVVLGWWRMRRLRRSGIPWREAQQLAASLGGPDAVEIVVHEHVNAPLTYGVLRPTIVLPPDAHEWESGPLRCALLHELEHVRRADWWTQLIARLICALYWFHPLVWVAYRQLCLEAEHACDDAVIAREESTRYADQLVTLARRMTMRQPLDALGMAHRSDLSARVRAVLDSSRPRGPAGLWRGGVIAVGAVALVVTIAPLQVTAARGSAQITGPGEPATLAETSSDVATERRRFSSELTRAEQIVQSAHLERVIVETAEEGDVARVRALLDGGVDINAVARGDGTPLIAAARGGHLALVQMLLERGADPNVPASGDGAPLIMAAREGHLRIAELLLDRGAQVDLVVPGDENALIQASGAGHLAVVQLLVGHGANVNARVLANDFAGRGGEWRTPLSMARRGGHREVAEFLISRGAVE